MNDNIFYKILKSETQTFALHFHNYMNEKEKVKRIIRDMVEIMYDDPGADDSDKEYALNTLIEAIFPNKLAQYVDN